jgi:uncharacterized membrane protein
MRSLFVTAGLTLGIGLGGFVDGIVLHQLLQWHHMLTGEVPATTVAGLELNTLGDGLFHSATWLFVVVGLALLWRAWRAGQVPARGGALAGLLLAGWGVFNVVEGVIDHHVLQIHHVREGPGQLAYDLGFLAFGALLIGLGWAWYRRAAPAGTLGA